MSPAAVSGIIPAIKHLHETPHKVSVPLGNPQARMTACMDIIQVKYMGHQQVSLHLVTEKMPGERDPPAQQLISTRSSSARP